ncbi:MAG: helix-turn-helix transcriptional regulator [Acidobacteria bacterium]|nr:helix-turn-helix transcriptional regulator [Acidobacteriota bacterium]
MLDPTLLLLASLADGQKHGYAMMTDIEAFAGIRLGAGTLYGAITRAEQRGLIESAGLAERRQPYRLTPAGRQQLRERLKLLDRVQRAAARREGVS